MNQQLINLVLALATGELIHNILEVSNVRRKVKRLSTYISGATYPEMKMQIDTRPKAYVLSLVGFAVVTAVLFGIFSIFNLTGNNVLMFLAIVLTLAYFATAILLDKYHVEIERVTRPYMKK
jgi:uncharacterized transporter YbjL